MNSNPLGCPNCGAKLTERELISHSLTIENCPQCETTVRQSSGFSGRNYAAIIAADIAEIDNWLDSHSIKNSKQIIKRNTKTEGEHLWAIGTRFDFACECVYHEHATSYIELRMGTKKYAQAVFQNRNALIAAAAKHSLQPFGTRHSSDHYTDGPSTDSVWGMTQYLSTNTLTQALLDASIDRINSAMKDAMSEMLGGSEA